jgi:hypothetical protein
MKIRDIAERLQKDLIERPGEKIKKLPKGRELHFIQHILLDSGYVVSSEKLRSLAAKSETYDAFILSATK